MNRRQRQRKKARRDQHTDVTRPVDRPAATISRKVYPPVNRGHIVPRMYQRAWEVDGRVCVHRVGENGSGHRLSTKKAGTRNAPYRRVRPSGEQIDDVEASLGVVEDKAAAPLRELNQGAPLTEERKVILAQFFGVQIMRGAVFFAGRREIARLFDEVPADGFDPSLLEEVGGDVDRAREKAVEAYLDPNVALKAMLTYGTKVGGVLSLMRWQIIRFPKPRIVYSDHPVVLWPLGLPESPPFRSQRLGPHHTLEIRVPLGPTVALLMNWIDQHDDSGMTGDLQVASEFNAFTASQADREWMHRPGRKPLIPWHPFRPLSRHIRADYDPSAVVRTKRFQEAGKFLKSASNRTYVQQIRVI